MSRVYSDPNIPIKIAPNNKFTISLESNPSTGYTWTAKYESTMIQLISPKEFVLQSTAIGGGGVELFDFRAKKTGETKIEMRYQREWEKTPLETKIFTVYISQH